MTYHHSCTRFVVDHTIEDASVWDAASRVAGAMVSELGAIAHEGQSLLFPTQYTRSWAVRCMSRCCGQMVGRTRNPQCSVPKQAWYSFINPLKG
ncbi:hypothetical protein TNCV_1444221 [Trichonephila clavipes]|nr:hypothetical protein TNCV_1444221 [Trichonephila clavipes]